MLLLDLLGYGKPHEVGVVPQVDRHTLLAQALGTANGIRVSTHGSLVKMHFALALVLLSDALLVSALVARDGKIRSVVRPDARTCTWVHIPIGP